MTVLGEQRRDSAIHILALHYSSTELGSKPNWKLPVQQTLIFFLEVFLILSRYSFIFIGSYKSFFTHSVQVFAPYHGTAAKSLQSCLTLLQLMNCSLQGSSVHEISQARILEWAAFPSPRDFPHLRIEPMSPALQADSSELVPHCGHLSLTTSRTDSQHLKEIMRTSAHL